MLSNIKWKGARTLKSKGFMNLASGRDSVNPCLYFSVWSSSDMEGWLLQCAFSSKKYSTWVSLAGNQVDWTLILPHLPCKQLTDLLTLRLPTSHFYAELRAKTWLNATKIVKGSLRQLSKFSDILTLSIYWALRFRYLRNISSQNLLTCLSVT